MTDLTFLWVRSKPVTLRAVQFDGTEAQALQVLEWMNDTAPGGTGGHFRPAVGEMPGAIFVPIQGVVWRVDLGDWVIQCPDRSMLLVCAARAAELYDLVAMPEVVPCRHH